MSETSSPEQNSASVPTGGGAVAPKSATAESRAAEALRHQRTGDGIRKSGPGTATKSLVAPHAESAKSLDTPRIEQPVYATRAERALAAMLHCFERGHAQPKWVEDEALEMARDALTPREAATPDTQVGTPAFVSSDAEVPQTNIPSLEDTGE